MDRYIDEPRHEPDADVNGVGCKDPDERRQLRECVAADDTDAGPDRIAVVGVVRRTDECDGEFPYAEFRGGRRALGPGVRLVSAFAAHDLLTLWTAPRLQDRLRTRRSQVCASFMRAGDLERTR